MVSFLDYTFDFLGILGKRDCEIGSQHKELVLAFELSGKMLGDLIHNAVVTDGTDELITRGCQLSLEEGEPENAGFTRLEGAADV